jgi:hypothetical protein
MLKLKCYAPPNYKSVQSNWSKFHSALHKRRFKFHFQDYIKLYIVCVGIQIVFCVIANNIVGYAVVNQDEFL